MRKLLAVLAFTTFAACGGDSIANPNSDSIEGTFSLRTVNGSPLPYTFQSGTNSFTLTSDVLTVASNGSWTESIAYRQTINGQTSTGTDADGGSWTRAGGSVNFRSSVSGSTAYNGTYSANTLTLDDGGGAVQVFKK